MKNQPQKNHVFTLYVVLYNIVSIALE